MRPKIIVMMAVMIILISSISAIDAQEIDENQTSSLESQVTVSSQDNSSDEVGFASKVSNDELLSASKASDDEVISNKAYLVIDNDADKENVYVGEYVTWILEAQNFGPDVAKNTKLHNKLPSGLKYIKHDVTKGTFNPKNGIWDIGNLSIEDGLVSLYITAKAITAGEKINTAYITTDTNNTNSETLEEEEIDVFERDDSDDWFNGFGLQKEIDAECFEER